MGNHHDFDHDQRMVRESGPIESSVNIKAAPHGRPIAALAVVGLGTSLAPLDFAVNIAFPVMTQAFELQAHSIRWVAVSLLLTYGSLMLVFGALGDRIGHLQVFRAGLITSVVAFIGCALAPSFGWLLAARVLQGVAVALTLSCGPALATLLFADSRRTWALSAYGAMAAVAALIAPVIGGASIALMGWPGVYWFRVPIMLMALICLPVVSRSLKQSPVPGREVARPDFDVVGSSLLAASVALLLLAPALPDQGPMRPGHSTTWIAGLCAVIGLTLMAAFIRRQRHRTHPFLPGSVVRNLDFWLINLAATIVQFTSFAVPLITPYYLMHVTGLSSLASGALLAIWAGGSLLGSGGATRLVRALGNGGAAFLAILLATAGLAGLAVQGEATRFGLMSGALFIQGLGLGLFQVVYTDLVVASLPLSARGVAGSLTMVTRTIGLVFGASLWMALLQGLNATARAESIAPHAAYAGAYDGVMHAAAMVSGGFLLLSCLRRGLWFGRR